MSDLWNLSGEDDHRSDAQVMRDCRTDSAEFRVIFDRHFDRVHGYLRRRLGDGGDDLAAEVFLIAFAQRERFDSARGDVIAWLFGIATNLLRGYRRAEAARLRAYRRAAVPELTDAGADVDERIDAEMLRPRLVDAIGGLTPAYRDALLLYAWADLDYAQIAVAVGVSVGTVRSRLYRARGRVEQALAGDGALASVVTEPCGGNDDGD